MVNKFLKHPSGIVMIIFCAGLSFVSPAYGAPSVSGVSGTVSNGQAVTISGSSFGASGPNVVLFDDFEKGTNGNNINLGSNSAQIGHWDSTGDSVPKYDNTYKISGNNAMMVDCQQSYAASFETNNLPSFNQAFLTYWLYMPTTSIFPTNSDGDNWKVSWFYGTDTGNNDIMIPLRLSGDWWSSDCNGCIASQHSFSPDWVMNKGQWVRLAIAIDAHNYNSSDYRKLWLSSADANISYTQYLTQNTQLFNSGGMMSNLSMNGYCRQTASESRARYDDVYLATGSNALARVEIGDASTYAASKKLTMVTPTSWSASSITGTVRQGVFANGASGYLYVTDAAGAVNANGYSVTFGSSGGGGDTTPPAAPSGLSVT